MINGNQGINQCAISKKYILQHFRAEIQIVSPIPADMFADANLNVIWDTTYQGCTIRVKTPGEVNEDLAYHLAVVGDMEWKDADNKVICKLG